MNRGIDSTILLRDVINGNSVESHIPLFSPLIESIEVSYDCDFPVSLGITATICGRVKHLYESTIWFEPEGCSCQEFSAGVTPLYNWCEPLLLCMVTRTVYHLEREQKGCVE